LSELSFCRGNSSPDASPTTDSTGLIRCCISDPPPLPRDISQRIVSDLLVHAKWVFWRVLNVYITIDTECSMGGAWDDPSVVPVTPERGVLGQIGDHFYGTPLIMDVLEESGFKGTFFVEVFSAYNVGEAELASAYRQIEDRGHNTQLHLHPTHYYYWQVKQGVIPREQVAPRSDILATHPRGQQRIFLQEGIRLFEKLIGKKPIGFRAGNYGASTTTLGVLAEVGIRCDSSYNAAYVGDTCLIQESRLRNGPWRHNGIWEVPVTNFRTGLWKWRGLKPMEISSVSSWEIRHVLEQADRLGLGTVTLILHSFSLLKRRDPQYRNIRPDRVVIGRLRNLCRFLASRRERFRVLTFDDALDLPESKQEPQLPDMGVVIPAIRKLVQGINRAYWI
jgi:hypothetical protein